MATVCLCAVDKYPFQALVIKPDIPHCIPRLGSVMLLDVLIHAISLLGSSFPYIPINVQVRIDSIIRDEMRSHC